MYIWDAMFFAHACSAAISPHPYFGAGMNGVSSTGEVQFVLYDFEELGCLLVIRLVIRSKREDFTHAEIHAFFAGTDVADALQQFVEVIRCGDGANGRVFQAFVVYGKAFLQVLAEGACRPLAKLGSTAGAHTVTNGDDHRQGVYLDLVILSVRSSCQL